MNEQPTQEWLMDMESRLSYLENLHTPAFSSYDEPKIEEPSAVSEGVPNPFQNLQNQIDQLKGKLVWFQNKFNEHLDKKKKETFTIKDDNTIK